MKKKCLMAVMTVILNGHPSLAQTARPHVYVEREVHYTSLDNMALIGGDHWNYTWLHQTPKISI